MIFCRCLEGGEHQISIFRSTVPIFHAVEKLAKSKRMPVCLPERDIPIGRSNETGKDLL